MATTVGTQPTWYLLRNSGEVRPRASMRTNVVTTVLSVWFTLGLFFWQIAVNAHIVRHAMDSSFGFALGGGRFGDNGLASGTLLLQRGDLLIEERWLLLEIGTLLPLLLEPLRCLFQPGFGVAKTAAPLGLLAARRRMAFAGSRSLAGARRSLGALVGNRFAGLGSKVPSAFHLRFEIGGIGKTRKRTLSARHRLTSRLGQRIEVGQPLFQGAALRLRPLDRCSRAVARPLGIAHFALCRQRLRTRRLRFLPKPVECFESGFALCVAVRDLSFEPGQVPSQFRQAIGADESLGRRRARAFRDKAIPPPHPPAAGHDALAHRERLARVFIGNADLAKTAHQFRGRLYMVGEAFESRAKRRIAR